MASELNKQIMRDVFAALAEGDGTLFRGRLADDVKVVVTGQYSWSQVFHGKERVLRDLYGYVHSRLQGRNTTRAWNFVADGDHVVVEARGDMRTRQGAAYRNDYCLVFRLHDGQIQEMREYQDSALCERLLGPYPHTP